MSIPKTIHYVWVGPNKIPKEMSLNIAEWKKLCPSFNFKKWDETNIPMEHPYVAAMYKKKLWAFVSDYVRFWVLYNEGGIYLDTDMKILRPLNGFLNEKAFFGKTKDGFIACGIIGSESEHPLIREAVKFYDSDNMFSTYNTSPRVITNIIKSKTNIDVVHVFDSSVFYPCDDGERCLDEKLDMAYTLHTWAESWVKFARFRKILRRIGVARLIKKYRNCI